MPPKFGMVFAALKPVLATQAGRLVVKTDTPTEYTLVTKAASPFPQHKGQPMWFGSVRAGKAYVSFHLMALYFNPALAGMISPALQKRMQGKTCFNFKSDPDPSQLAELKHLTSVAVEQWAKQHYL